MQIVNSNLFKITVDVRWKIARMRSTSKGNLLSLSKGNTWFAVNGLLTDCFDMLSPRLECITFNETFEKSDLKES